MKAIRCVLFRHQAASFFKGTIHRFANIESAAFDQAVTAGLFYSKAMIFVSKCHIIFNRRRRLITKGAAVRLNSTLNVNKANRGVASTE